MLITAAKLKVDRRVSPNIQNAESVLRTIPYQINIASLHDEHEHARRRGHTPPDHVGKLLL